jgi:hypothetical protein
LALIRYLRIIPLSPKFASEKTHNITHHSVNTALSIDLHNYLRASNRQASINLSIADVASRFVRVSTIDAEFHSRAILDKKIAPFLQKCAGCFLGCPALIRLDTDSSSDPLVAWYKLDDGSGTTAADSSAYDNDGTLIGVPEWVSGHLNGGLDFNGISDYVDCGNDVSLDITDAVTLTAWVDTNDCNNGEHNPYVTKGDTSYAIKHYLNNSIQFFIYDGTWYQVDYLIDDSFNDDWHHVAGTYDGMQLKLYVDGILSGVTNHIGSIATNTYNVNIGRNSEATDRFYDGLIDDVRIYDKALSQAEIVSIMDGTLGSVSNYHPITSPAELYDGETQGSRKIDFKDFAVMAADSWLEEPLLWP